MDQDQTRHPIPAQAEGEQVLPGDKTMLTAPSGLELHLQDVVWNAPGPDGLTLRFRFVAPTLAGATDEMIATTSEDMFWLCQTYALPRVPEGGPRPAQIVISVADRELPFGEPAPDALQLFEAYTITEEGMRMVGVLIAPPEGFLRRPTVAQTTGCCVDFGQSARLRLADGALRVMDERGPSQAAHTSRRGLAGERSFRLTPQEYRSRGCRRAQKSYSPCASWLSQPHAHRKSKKSPSWSLSPPSRPTPASTSNLRRRSVPARPGRSAPLPPRNSGGAAC